MPWLREGPGGVTLEILVQPRASRTRVVGEHDGRLKIQLAAPPVDGEANAALVELFAELFGVPKRQVALAAGETGRRSSRSSLGSGPPGAVEGGDRQASWEGPARRAQPVGPSRDAVL